MKEFEKQYEEAVNSMTENGMEELLLELSGTKFWPAILRYNRRRDELILSALSTIDPFKEPTQTARNQGIRTGLFDLEEMVLIIKEKVKEAEKTKEKK